MKKRVFVLVIIVALLITIPASAKQKTTGTQINLYAGDAFTFDENTPFYILHGFGGEDVIHIKFKYLDFKLFIDGVQQVPDSISIAPETGEGRALFSKLWTFNYPDGFTAGEYVFHAEWLLACYYAVELGKIPGPCADPYEMVIGRQTTKVGTFLSP
jgi:hypothetical protein